MMLSVKTTEKDTGENIDFVRTVLEKGFAYMQCDEKKCNKCAHRWGCLAVRNAIEYIKRLN